jgi:predicted acyltransferase
MTNRASSIDLLRGFALLMMIFSGMIPFGGALPAWMYHAQVPPPLHQFNPNLAGLTWVDLVFPFFLFSMGASVSFALPKKLAHHGLTRTFGELLRRSIRLLFIAIIGWQFHPLRLPTLGWWAGIAGLLTYLGLFLAFFTFPNKTGRQKFITGGLSAVILSGVAAWLMASGKEIDPSVNDAIMRVLANVYFFGSIIWIVTNGGWSFRLGIAVFIIALYLGSLQTDSWVSNLWSTHDIFNLVSPMLLKYLLIFIPGTIVGDMLIAKFVNSANDADDDDEDEEEKEDEYDEENYTFSPVWVENHEQSDVLMTPAYQRWAAIVYGIVALGTTITTVWATFERDMGTGLAFAIGFAVFGFISVFILGSALTEEQILSRGIGVEQYLKIQLIIFGFFLLIIGYFLEPFQGGVKKDHATLSYFFLTSGLATLWILAFNHFYPRLWITKIMKPIEYLGQNALMAYLMAGFLIVPIMNLTHLSDLFIAPSPDKIAVFGLAKAVVITSAVMGLTAFLSKKEVFWKI